MAEGRAIVKQFLDAMNRNDAAALDEVLHDDFVIESPQSGERTRGKANFIATILNYPQGERLAGSIDIDRVSVVGGEERWIMTPSFRLVGMEGSGDTITAWQKVRYPDDTDWHVIQVMRIRDGKIAHITSFFAQDFEPPAWRARWVERM